MGLLSSLKKLSVVGSILSGAKKVFSGIASAVGKVLSNKFVKYALLATTLVVPVIGMATAGWTAAGAQGASIIGQVGGALGNVATGVAKMAVGAVTTPFKMLAEGGSKVAGMFDANGLASTLSNTAKTIGGAPESIFGAVKQDSIGQIIGKLGAGPQGAPQMPAHGAPVASGGEPAASAKAAGGNSQADYSGDNFSKWSAAQPQAAQAQKPSSYLDKALGFVKNNPEVSKMAFQAVAAAAAPDPQKEQQQWMDKQRQQNNREWQNFNTGATGVGQAVDQYGQAIQDQFQPIDFSKRAQQARNFINTPIKSPLIQRPVINYGPYQS